MREGRSSKPSEPGRAMSVFIGGGLHLLREHWNYISSSLIKPKAKPTAKPKAKPVSYTVPMAVVSQPIMATCLHTVQREHSGL